MIYLKKLTGTVEYTNTQTRLSSINNFLEKGEDLVNRQGKLLTRLSNSFKNHHRNDALKKRSFLRKKSGMTLVELMIVTVIVSILAAVAIPIYQGNVNRSKASEADGALGSIRTALRVYFAENSSYPYEATYVAVTTLSINIAAADLDGAYFSNGDYTYQSNADSSSFTLRATGSGSQSGINIELTSAGVLSNF